MRLDHQIISSFDGERLSLSYAEAGHKNWVIMTHGIGEHSGRHHELASLFSKYANVCLYDLRGHGKSSGERAFVNDFFYFTRDLMEVIRFLQKEFKLKKFCLYGHSMGGLIVSDFLQNYASVPSNIIAEGTLYPSYVLLSAPPIEPAGWLGSVVRKVPLYWINILASMSGSVRISGLIDIYYLSHDVRVFEQYLKDPLNSMKLHTKLLLQLTKRARLVFSRPLGVKCPLHCVVGTKDRLIDYRAIVDYFERIETNGKVDLIVDGYHELHNEVERIRSKFLEVVEKTIIAYLKQP